MSLHSILDDYNLSKMNVALFSNYIHTKLCFVALQYNNDGSAFNKDLMIRIQLGLLFQQ